MMEVLLGDRAVGDGHKCYVIAEIGINHNGDPLIAERLIDVAAFAGCAAVKFQKRTIEVVYTPDELAKRGLPATIFVAPARIDGHVFWWDALSANDGALDRGVRDHALNHLAGADEPVRAWAARTAAGCCPVPSATRRWDCGCFRRRLRRFGLRSGLRCFCWWRGCHLWARQPAGLLMGRQGRVDRGALRYRPAQRLRPGQHDNDRP